MRVDIRGARASDLPAVFDLLEAAFPEASRDLFVAQTEGDSTFRLRHGRVAVLDGRVAGYVRIFRRTMLVRGEPVLAGGIGSVATHPEGRGSGIATALLRDAIEQMRREGMRVSYLFTGLPEFYERLGYRIVGQPSFEIDQREAAAATNAGTYEVRAIEDGEVPRLLAIYERGVATSTGAIVRTRRTWRDATRWLDEDAAGCFVAEHTGALVGYVRSRCRERGHQILEAECLAGHGGAIGDLLAAVARRAIEHGEPIYALVPGDHALAALLRLLPSTREWPLPTHPMMVRTLVDDPALDAAFAHDPMHHWNCDRI